MLKACLLLIYVLLVLSLIPSSLLKVVFSLARHTLLFKHGTVILEVFIWLDRSTLVIFHFALILLVYYKPNPFINLDQDLNFTLR